MQRSETAIRTTHAGKLPPVGDAKDRHRSRWPR